MKVFAPKEYLLCLFTLLTLFFVSQIVPGLSLAASSTLSPSYGKIDSDIASIAYSGHEYFKYDISWTGGIKIGEMYQEIRKSDTCPDCFELHSKITSSGGIIHRLYPVEDIHITYVRGNERLPYFCEIWQKEGRSYSAHKKIVYDQKKYVVVKKKDGDDTREYKLDGTVHNEFSSFFSSRVMDLRVGNSFVVPTFGDERRHEVIVEISQKEKLQDTLLGEVDTVRVTPILHFSGLYDKRGDTIIWYTDDECRVPVLIRSKIVIGSLTAKLTEYTNLLCRIY